MPMFGVKKTIALTTDASGDCTAYSDAVNGRILGIIYTKVDFDNGVDFTITLNTSGEAILTLTNQNVAAVFYPRVGVHDAVGAAATLDGTRLLRDPVFAVDDKVKCVVAQGGNVKTGTITVIVG